MSDPTRTLVSEAKIYDLAMEMLTRHKLLLERQAKLRSENRWYCARHEEVLTNIKTTTSAKNEYKRSSRMWYDQAQEHAVEIEKLQENVKDYGVFSSEAYELDEKQQEEIRSLKKHIQSLTKEIVRYQEKETIYLNAIASIGPNTYLKKRPRLSDY